VSETPELIARIEGKTGRIRLNRPRALHALTTEMCAAMTLALDAWRGDLGIEAVLIDHADGRGFCAGGDVRRVAESGATDGAYARDFFRAEYRLNHLLHSYVKPTIAFMDGVTMGGGVGLALPCRYRVATERTLFAMPETAIGLFPDVGGGWYFARLPGRYGQWLVLTGARIGGAECLALGLATHFVPSERLDAVKAAIAERPRDIAHILADVTETPEAALPDRALIDRAFASDRFEEVLAALDREWPELAAELRSKSPQACKVSLGVLMRGARFTDFADEMRMEYGVATHVCQRHDFIEGVRAVLVDKDNAPRWEPGTAEGVTDHMIDIIFAPLPADEEWTPHRS
jgi:enoyl-CoA hydratase